MYYDHYFEKPDKIEFLTKVEKSIFKLESEQVPQNILNFTLTGSNGVIEETSGIEQKCHIFSCLSFEISGYILEI